MMLAKDDEFVKDFVERTKENYLRLENGPYEVTQLVNSAIGLLIIPQQKRFKQIADSMISDELYRKMVATVKKSTYKKPLKLPEIARHIRNSIAHANIEFEAEKQPRYGQPLLIHTIRFTDINPKTKNTVVMELTVDLLKEFFFHCF